MTQNGCPLCNTSGAILFYEDHWRSYLRCQNCQLVYVPPEFHLSPEAEKAEYDLHQNSPDQPGYRKFLSRLHDPMVARLKEHSYGLAFGCGPGPTLSVMFTESGHQVEIHDPFYFNAPKTLTGHPADRGHGKPPYDFITASEVVEHLRHPADELNRLWGCLKPNGILGIMTKRVRDQTSFSHWHYKDDRTHILFFSRSTFRWLAQQWSAHAEFIGADVVLLKHP